MLERGRAASLPVSAYSVYYLVQDITLKAIQARTGTDRRPKLNPLQLMIVVCLAVLMVVALVHVADGHSTTSAADNCPVCIVMHSVAPLVVMAVAIVLIRTETPAPEFFEARAIIRHWHPNLFTRPPPACC
jgi:hypothetical protein